MKKVFYVITGFVKRHKKVTIFLLTVIVIYLAASPFVEVHLPDSQAYNCFSVVLDKWSMNSVDKIIIGTPKKETVITERDLIKNVVKETMVAETTGVQGEYQDCYMQLYAGEQLVRTILLNTMDKDRVMVYEADRTHWIYDGHNGGVTLSQELLEQIEKQLNENDDTYLNGSLYNEKERNKVKKCILQLISSKVRIETASFFSV